MAKVDVNPADLRRIADSYRELAARAAQISPQAAVEVQRIAETHGPIGYPSAIGVTAGLARAEGAMMAKIADLTIHAERFDEHAGAYTDEDSQGAVLVRASDFTADTPRSPGGTAALDWKPGDHRHMPWVVGPDGPKPPAHPGAPRWIEIGPGSGKFVRAEEIPGAVVKTPGELGPPPFYDHVGDEHGYVELVPHSGVWVPDTVFPDAHFSPPGKPGVFGPPGTVEYLPGSGIWVPRDSLVPEPFAPLPKFGVTAPGPMPAPSAPEPPGRVILPPRHLPQGLAE